MKITFEFDEATQPARKFSDWLEWAMTGIMPEKNFITGQMLYETQCQSMNLIYRLQDNHYTKWPDLREEQKSPYFSQARMLNETIARSL